MSTPAPLLELIRKLQAIAQTGLAFTRDPYDRERYLEVQSVVSGLLGGALGVPPAAAAQLFAPESGYATPKLEVRGAVFDGARVLLVRERSDGCWTLPGGWVDVNDAPSQAVAREIREESGYEARAVKLAALIDRRRHPHPPHLHHIYKLMFVCELTGGAPAAGLETDAVDFFPVGSLPPLSLGRTLPAQVAHLYRHRLEPALPTEFD